MIFPEAKYNCTMDQRLFDEYPVELKKTRYLFTLAGRPWGMPIELIGADGWSWDLANGIYSGYTVSYFALQLAVYMGFQEIIYLGLDLKNHEGKTHFFGADFRSRDHEKTEFPKMRRMLESGATTLADQDVRVFNCSPTSDLECFERITYEAALAL